MPPDLIDPSMLADFPGAPFAATLVDVAVASVRSDAGWHIAPKVTETLKVDGFGGQLLTLPTRRIVEITEVRDPRGIILTDWTILAGGLFRRWSWWQIGTYEVDLTHGYDSAPLDLLPVIVQRIQTQPVAANVTEHSVAVGTARELFKYRLGGDRGTQGGGTVDPVIAKYAVSAGFA
jgi:hypothetical protein